MSNEQLTIINYQLPITNEQISTGLRFNDDGLIPVIVQDAAGGQVLMMAWANRESLRLMLQTGETWFWSRSRQELWHKGATSGNIQKVRALYYDCDGDTLLAQVDPAGPACHTGNVTCFYRQFEFSVEPSAVATEE